MKHWVRTSFACSSATGLLFSSFCSFSKNSLKWDSFLFLWLWQSNEHPPAIWRFGVTNNEWTIFVFTFTWRLIPFTLFIRTTTSCPVDIRHKLWRFLFPPVPDGILSNSLTQLVTIVDSFVVLLHNGQWNDFKDFASTDDRQNETLTKRLWLWLDFSTDKWRIFWWWIFNLFVGFCSTSLLTTETTIIDLKRTVDILDWRPLWLDVTKRPTDRNDEMTHRVSASSYSKRNLPSLLWKKEPVTNISLVSMT